MMFGDTKMHTLCHCRVRPESDAVKNVYQAGLSPNIPLFDRQQLVAMALESA